MKKILLNYLICPNCNVSLQLKEGYASGGTEINDGLLLCNSCKSGFPIKNGIPRFVPEENYSTNFGLQWNIFKKTQLDSFTKRSLSRQRFFRQSNWKPEEMKGALILDAGCGAGRFAEIALETGAMVIAIDYSNAVDACWDNLKHHNANLHVVQADINALPFRQIFFNYVYSFGVLQHTPDVKKSFFSLVTKTAVNGKICVDCYAKDWRIYFWVKYWLRPFMKNLPLSLLLNIVRKLVPLLLPVGCLLIKVPLIGYYLRYILPVANYKGIYALNEQQLVEWAVLDTFDMYSAKFDNPQTIKTMKKWLREADLSDREVLNQGVIVGRGVKKNHRNDS